MSRPATTQPLLPSILDRLIDHAPQTRVEALRSRTEVLRELRESVRRDLEHLLNTRQSGQPPSMRYPELAQSLLTFGVPDFTGAGLAVAQERQATIHAIEQAIRRFEPRLKSVRVQLSEDAGVLDRTLRFRIDAILNIQPAVAPVVFDSFVDPVTRNTDIRDSSSG